MELFPVEVIKHKNFFYKPENEEAMVAEFITKLNEEKEKV